MSATPAPAVATWTVWSLAPRHGNEERWLPVAAVANQQAAAADIAERVDALARYPLRATFRAGPTDQGPAGALIEVSVA